MYALYVLPWCLIPILCHNDNTLLQASVTGREDIPGRSPSAAQAKYQAGGCIKMISNGNRLEPTKYRTNVKDGIQDRTHPTPSGPNSEVVLILK